MVGGLQLTMSGLCVLPRSKKDMYYESFFFKRLYYEKKTLRPLRPMETDGRTAYS